MPLGDHAGHCLGEAFLFGGEYSHMGKTLSVLYTLINIAVLRFHITLYFSFIISTVFSSAGKVVEEMG